MKLHNESVRRFLIGGLCGVIVMLAAACFLELLAGGIRGVFHFPTLVGHGAQDRFGSYGLALLVQSVLLFALGGMAGIATLPFAEEVGLLLRRSILHFLVTALFYSLLLVLCFDLIPNLLPGWLVMLLVLYVVIWLGRYVGWYVELLAIRDKLGLSPAPSPLKWRQTQPYLPFLLLLCLVLPVLARLCDPIDVPVASGILLPLLFLPTGCLAAGFSLGKRQGFCPLYPIAAFVCYLPAVFVLFNTSALYHCFIAGGAALIGNLAGALRRRAGRHKKEA